MNEPVTDGRNLLELPTVHKAYLVQQTYGTDTVRCGVCSRGCSIEDGRRGVCGTRVNVEGQVYTMTYGDILASESRPVEMKPFFHFYPGSTMLTISTASCNFSCPWCQNHEQSRATPRPSVARHVPMREIVDAAREAGDSGICVSFTEPLMLFEYCLGLFRETGAKKMPCSFVTNGYMTSDALHMLNRAGLNAMSVDVKGSDAVYRDYCGAEAGAQPVWDTVTNALEMGIHIEVVHLVVTGVSDDEESFAGIVSKHLEHAGPSVPLHINAYRPACDFTAEPTSVEFLEKAHAMAKDAGILFAYVGNVPGHRLANTWCPRCGELLMERSDGHLTLNLLDGSNCPKCGFEVPIIP